MMRRHFTIGILITIFFHEGHADRFAPEDVGFMKPEVRPSIIEGLVADDGQFPWSLSLQHFVDGNWKHVCGASLLDNRWAMTAAHCALDLPQTESEIIQTVRVVGGTNELFVDGKGQIVKAWRFKIHPWYLDVFPYICDVALIQLRAPGFDLNDRLVSPIPLPMRSEDFTGSRCLVTGWGVFQAGLGLTSSILLRAEVTAISRQDCTDAWTHIWIGHICDQDLTGVQRSCSGDSGSALMCERGNTGEIYFAGVVSWGESECKLGNPTVNARISWNYIYNFIRDRKK